LVFGLYFPGDFAGVSDDFFCIFGLDLYPLQNGNIAKRLPFTMKMPMNGKHGKWKK
jgi:hypothetical protein